jgi:hypothetical protein
MDTLVSVNTDALPSNTPEPMGVVAIPWSEFKEFGMGVPGMRDWTAYTVVTKYYCGAMVMDNLCPQKCALCKPTIAFMFSNMQVAKSARGMLIWRARSAVAKTRDKAAQNKIPVQLPEWLQASEVNPFAQLSIAFL